MESRLRILLCGIILLIVQWSAAQGFHFGADMSYVNEMEDCGAVYHVEGQPRDPYLIMHEEGANLIRLRLWHSPAWYDDLNNGYRYSDHADVARSISRARALGMQVMLDFHLSDNWADPAHQIAPAAWNDILDDLPALQGTLYNYMYGTLASLATDSLLPDMVQIGNETNKGILQSQAQNDAGWWLDWPRNAALFNSAIQAVRDVETATGKPIKVALHIADPADVTWFFDQFWANGVQDFDIIGISYYAAYHQLSISSVGHIIGELKEAYPGKEVMLLETAYPWTTAGNDAAANLLTGIIGYPPSVESQRQWMIDLTQAVMDHGGSGVVYWEPAWVSTSCHTQWAQGSHWENATYFDFQNQLHEDGVKEWMTYSYTTSLENDTLSPSPFFMYTNHDVVFIKQLQSLDVNTTLMAEIIGIDGRVTHRAFFQSPGKGSVIVLKNEMQPGVYMVRIVDGESVIAVGKVFMK